MNKPSFYTDELKRLEAYIGAVNQDGADITDVVQIGIGGSCLGPKFLCLALKRLWSWSEELTVTLLCPHLGRKWPQM